MGSLFDLDEINILLGRGKLEPNNWYYYNIGEQINIIYFINDEWGWGSIGDEWVFRGGSGGLTSKDPSGKLVWTLAPDEIVDAFMLNQLKIRFGEDWTWCELEYSARGEDDEVNSGECMIDISDDFNQISNINGWLFFNGRFAKPLE